MYKTNFEPIQRKMKTANGYNDDLKRERREKERKLTQRRKNGNQQRDWQQGSDI